MSKQEFFIEQLKPYFLDPTICGYDFGIKSCRNITPEGKKCVFGKNLTEEFINSNFSQYDTADELLSNHGFEILIEESRGELNVDEWVMLQQIHDRLAYYSMDNMDITIKDNLLTKISYVENRLDIDLSELKNLIK
jgi:hypothetical protein